MDYSTWLADSSAAFASRREISSTGFGSRLARRLCGGLVRIWRAVFGKKRDDSTVAFPAVRIQELWNRESWNSQFLHSQSLNPSIPKFPNAMPSIRVAQYEDLAYFSSLGIDTPTISLTLLVFAQVADLRFDEMTFKDDVRNKTGAFLTKSQEIFEKIFAQATRELKIRRKPKPAVQKPVPAPSPEAPRTKGEKPKDARRPEKGAVTYKTSEKVKATPAPKPKPKPRPRAGGGSRFLRVSLLIVLLLVLAGFLANHFAIVDLAVIPDLLGLGPKQVVQAPIPRKQPAKPPEKSAISPKQTQGQEKVPTPPPAPSEPTPPAVSKEEKLVELETPTTIAQSKPGKEQVEEKASSPSALTSDQPKPPEVAAKARITAGAGPSSGFRETQRTGDCSLSAWHSTIPLFCLSGLFQGRRGSEQSPF